MRDGAVAVAEPGAHPAMSLVRALKREFGFYCIDLCVEQPVKLGQSETSFVVGGWSVKRPRQGAISSMEQYDASLGQWGVVAAMHTPRARFGECEMVGELCVTGGLGKDDRALSSVEKYSPGADAWSVVTPLPELRSYHVAVAVGSAMYVLGGNEDRKSAFVYDSLQHS